MNDNYINVSDINKIVKYVIDSNYELQNVYIKGEISNFKSHTSKHLYFSLKDDTSKIDAVMFSYNAQKLSFVPKDGDSVLVRGRISVYEATGRYQVYVEEMNLDGLGNLYILFEELKKKLSKEGLFDETHKKPIPKIPKKVGVVTASTGAAIKDIISTINNRFPLVEIYVFPTLVQGSLAKDNIVKMIELAQDYELDTLIVGRGGGSIEDLWPFNEEVVARAIYNSKVPIISAVGHEIDYTISDFVADLRSATPTAAATAAVPDKEEILSYLLNARNRINISLVNKINNSNELLNKYRSNYLLNNPQRLYESYEQNLDSLNEKLYIYIKTILDKNVNLLDTLKIKVNLLNPDNILSKGYSIIYKDKNIISDSKKLKESDIIDIVFNKGTVKAEVKEK